MLGWFGSPPNRAGSSWESHTGAERGREAHQEGWKGMGPLCRAVMS